MTEQQIKDIVDGYVPQVMSTTKGAIKANLSYTEEDKKEEISSLLEGVIKNTISQNGIIEKSYRDVAHFYDMAMRLKTDATPAGLEAGLEQDEVNQLMVSSLLGKINDEAQEAAQLMIQEHEDSKGDKERMHRYRIISLCMQFSVNLNTLSCSKVLESVFGVDLSDQIILSQNALRDDGKADVTANLATFSDDGELILGEEVNPKRAASMREAIEAIKPGGRKEDEEEDLDKKI